MTKLTKGQLVTLSSAREREDGAIDLPKHLKSGVVAKVVKPRQRQPDKIKPSSGNKNLTPTKRSTNSSAARTPRVGSKLALVVKMLGRVHGVSIDDLTKATDWLPHTARAVITSLRNKGYRIETERNPEKKTIYRINTAGKTAARRKAA